MRLSEALDRLAVLETRGVDFHYTSCGFFNQGLFTTPKSKDDPTRICTCGRDEALEIVVNSRVGRLIYNEIANSEAVRKMRNA